MKNMSFILWKKINGLFDQPNRIKLESGKGADTYQVGN